jgi:drug/metabolite transporter (DMT)-like permease
LSWPALGAIVFWGFSFIATKVAIQEVHPFSLLAFRFGIGACLLFLIQFFRDRHFLNVFTFRDWVSILLLGMVGIMGHNLLQAYGLLSTTAIHTGWIVAIQPIFITLAARLFLREGITVRKGVGIFLGFLGVFMIISKGTLSFTLLHSPSTLGDFLVLFSAITWTAFTVGGRGFLSRHRPLTTITPTMGVGFLTTFLLSGIKVEWDFTFRLSPLVWVSILFLGIFCSGLAYFFWYSALEKRDSSVVSAYLFLEPLVTLVGAYLFLGESVGWVTLIGGGVILLGVYLTTQSVKPKHH